MLPVRADASSEVFFQGTRLGEFRVLFNQKTREYLAPNAVPDDDDFEYVPASGRGRIVSWSVVHSSRTEDDPETVVGIVELEEGLWWWTRLVDVDPHSPLEGTLVRVAFISSGPDPADEMIPVFTADQGSRKT